MKYLGAPIGGPDFCNNFTKAEVVKLQPLFNALADIEEPQFFIFLLKNCSAYRKMVYSARKTPHDCYPEALGAFDHKVRFFFERSTGIHWTDLLFHPIVIKVARENNLDLCFGYEEGAILSGYTADVAAAFYMFQQET